MIYGKEFLETVQKTLDLSVFKTVQHDKGRFFSVFLEKLNGSCLKCEMNSSKKMII